MADGVDGGGAAASPARPTERPTPLIREADLARFYRAVSLAHHEGKFNDAHGPLEQTAWLHVTERVLEELEAGGRRVADGDLAELARIRSMLASYPKAGACCLQPNVDEARRRRPFVRPREPLAVAVAGALLGRLDANSPDRWADRTIRAYAGGVAAIEQGLGAADAYLRGRINAAAFEDALRASNTFGGPAHAGHGGADGNKHDDAGHVHYDHVHGEELDPSATKLGQAMGEVASAAERNSDKPIADMLRDLGGTVGRLPKEYRDRQVPLGLLAAAWDQIAPEWAPIQARKPIAPIPREGDRDLCVDGQPNSGGRWEIATVHATDTAKYCPPAQALDDLSARLYADAGASLIRAQNEWINAKECFRDPDTGGCIRKEDQGYSHCDEEEDRGYSHCDREEDHGHRDCCHWAPCSWVCDAWVWISHVVCVASTWISNVVCVASTWITKMVCVAWKYVLAVGCAVGHIATAAVNLVRGVGGIIAGAFTRTVAGALGSVCKFIGWGGQTSTSDRLKVVGVHMAVFHTGKVAIFSYDEGVQPVSASEPADFTAIGDSDRALCAIWDPVSGEAHYVDVGQNVFCSHHAFAETGELLVVAGQFPLPGLLKSLWPPELLAPGADRDVHLFDPVAERWQRLDDMVFGRWYPTCATLPDGRIFITSGTNGWATEAGMGRGIQDTWEIIDPVARAVSSPQPLPFHLYHLYPFVQTLPSGKVFLHSKRTTHLFDPKATSEAARFERIAPRVADSEPPGTTNDPYSRTGPGPGTCVLLPLVPTRERSGRITYPKGRILILGGGGEEGKGEPEMPGDGGLDSYDQATNSAEILDLADADPKWAYTLEPMHYSRVMPDAIALPTGKVLVLGGGQKGQSGGLLAHFTSSETGGRPNKGATEPALVPELFDPDTGQWSKLCRKPLDRLYHTTALLLPDARVLVAGHDGALNMPPYDSSRYELELFSPPYLFGTDGRPAQRPVISAAPDRVAYGETFEIRSPQAASLSGVALIRQGSVTHQTNSDQRFVGLAVVGTGDGSVRVAAPPSGGVAPPGHYMLFVVDRAGVPSVAHWMRVGPAPG